MACDVSPVAMFFMKMLLSFSMPLLAGWRESPQKQRGWHVLSSSASWEVDQWMLDLCRDPQARMVEQCKKNWVARVDLERQLQPSWRLGCHSKEGWNILSLSLLPSFFHYLLFHLEVPLVMESLHPRWSYRCGLSRGAGGEGRGSRWDQFLPLQLYARWLKGLAEIWC